MQYHAISLAMAGSAVDIVGYAGSTVIPALATQARIRCHRVREVWRPRPAAGRLLFLAGCVFKALADSAQLFWMLLAAVPRPDAVLVQNPPAVPSLLLAWIAARARGAKFSIDWHNFGHSMLALRLGRGHPVVIAGRWYERAMARRADDHLCVSRAMQRLLERDFGIAAAVLYDFPPGCFRRSSVDEREKIYHELHDVIFPADTEASRQPRPMLLVSPTSWTRDEDYALLLEGIRLFDERLQAGSQHNGSAEGTRLILLITGQGPLRAQFEARISGLQLRHSAVRTSWLEPGDYPRLLRIADAGVCVHRSASGVDLPIKIADMFGSGLPVLALDYGPCLHERVQHGVTGLCFRDAAEMAQYLYDLFASFPRESPLLSELRRNVLVGAQRRWEEEWTAVARPLLLN